MNPTKKAMAKYLEHENAKWPDMLIAVPRDQWPEGVKRLTHVPQEVLRSKTFLVQLFVEANCAIRMSVNRTSLEGDSWGQNITWEELQTLKREAGFGPKAAVEIYPPDDDVVNVANMRHLFIMHEPPSFMWKKS